MIPELHLTVLPVFIPMTAGVLGLICYKLPRVQAWIALAGMASALIASLALLGQVRGAPYPLVFQAGGWEAPFGITFVADLVPSGQMNAQKELLYQQITQVAELAKTLGIDVEEIHRLLDEMWEKK